MMYALDREDQDGKFEPIAILVTDFDENKTILFHTNTSTNVTVAFASIDLHSAKNIASSYPGNDNLPAISPRFRNQ